MTEKVNKTAAVQPAADTAAEKLAKADGDQADTVALDPYPPYGEMTLAQLRTAARNRGVTMNRDVEKAELVKVIRAKQPDNEALGFMPLEDLRSLADTEDVNLDETFEKAHLITELRAADSGA